MSSSIPDRPRAMVRVTFHGRPNQTIFDERGRLDRRLFQMLTRRITGIAKRHGGDFNALVHTLPVRDLLPVENEYGAEFLFERDDAAISAFIGKILQAFPAAIIDYNPYLAIRRWPEKHPRPINLEDHRSTVMITAIPRPGVVIDDAVMFDRYAEAEIDAMHAYGPAMVMAAAKNCWWHIYQGITPDMVDLAVCLSDDILEEDRPDEVASIGEYSLGFAPALADPALAAIPGLAVTDGDAPVRLAFDAEAWFDRASRQEVTALLASGGLPGPSYEVDGIVGWLVANGHRELKTLVDEDAMIDVTIDQKAMFSWLRKFRPDWSFAPTEELSGPTP